MSATGDVLAPGTRLDGLEIKRVLGAGGFGVTYLARDLGLDAWRAVKEYLPKDWGARRQDGTVGPRTGSDAKDYRWGLDRFLGEARMLARFKHPHIVQVHRVFEAGGTAYMVMEYVEGRTLASVADAEGPLGESLVREVLEALTDGLSSVHAVGLLHRDISPDNVMLRSDGTPVLIDFGAARHGLGEQSGALSSVLKAGYAPLEQYPPGRGQGPWTDIYGLGALAYWALSGARPTAATERTRRDPLRPLSEVAARGVSSGLSSAVEAALSVYSEDRPQSLDEWRKLLKENTAPPPDPRRWWPAAVAAVGLAVAVVAVAWLAPWRGGLPDGEPAPDSAALTASEPGGIGEPAVAGSTNEDTPEAELAAEAERRRPGRVFRDCEVCPEMVVLPGGGLAMGRYEVTVGEYRAFASATASDAGDCLGGSWRDPGFPQTDRHPVACVSWDDAQEYVSWLSRRSGAAYRLPTGAEWERAAAGSQPGCVRLRIRRLDGACPVGSSDANAAGLSDMVGSLWEWTSDCWVGNAIMRAVGLDCASRVVRGGSWKNPTVLLRPGAREGLISTNRSSDLGFRVSRTLD